MKKGNKLIVVPTRKQGLVIESTSSMLIDQWVKESDVNEMTSASYKSAATKFVAYLQTIHVDLSAITEAILIDYREYQKKTNAETTAKLYFGRARKFTAWLAKRGYLASNVAEGVKGVKVNTSEHQRDALSAEELAKLLDSFKGDKEIDLRNKAIVAVLGLVGLRTIEVVRLDCGDIEKRRGNWTMRVWGKGRSGKGESVVLPDEVKKMIDEYLATRHDLTDNSPLFASTSNRDKGARLQTQTISRMVKAQLAVIEISSKRIVAHSLRHTNATIAIEEGVDLENVSLNLRHRSTATTAIYRHDTKALTNPANKIVASAVMAKLKELLCHGRQ